jgi:hypothetical protein
MSNLSIFGLVAVIISLICYALEVKSHWWVLGFAISCIFCAIYGFMQGAWPIGVAEIVWCGVSLHKWRVHHKAMLERVPS